MLALRPTPLCPAGHLPRKGGDRMSPRLSPNINVEGKAPSTELPISPFAGEMSGRTEGGVKKRHPWTEGGLSSGMACPC
ncbi:lytic murein transglycosylase [Mesorhizobium waimense]|uniref:Lytic murein transglycosylase n=1 Tax=Mesorhizobium waimense TaxID=1300307 RepID=A0A3A5KW34_9HYPH|nr:lytic murein transglycosylase [Mesorhizobium waimense]